MAAGEIAEMFHDLDAGANAGFLIGVSARVAAARDGTGVDFLVDIADDRAEQTGTGRWALEAALEFGVTVPTIAAAVEFCMLSADDRLRREAKRRASAGVRPPAASRDKMIAVLDPAMVCAISSEFAQGFGLLAAAGDRFGAALDRRRVVSLWRSGSILRSAMVDRIADGLAAEPERMELLGSAGLRPLVVDGIGPLHRLTTAAPSMGLPAPGLASAVGRARLSTRFIQLQRDHFGGHGFRRIRGDAPVRGSRREDDG